MAKENAVKFINSIVKNNKVAKKFNKLKTLDEMYDFAIKNSEGDFTKEEISEVFDSLPSIISKLDSGEISEDNLENVSGGFFGFGESDEDKKARRDHEEKMRGKGIVGSWSYTEAGKESTGRTITQGIGSIASLISALTNAYQTYYQINFQEKMYNDQQQEKTVALAAQSNKK